MRLGRASIAPFEGSEVRAPDLRLAFGAEEVDAPRFSRRHEALPEGIRARARTSLALRLTIRLRPDGAGVVAGRHRSSPSSASAGATPALASRRRTGRAFEPSKDPM